MKKLLILLFLIPSVVLANPSPVPISQQRLPNEAFQDVLTRIKKTVPSTILFRENPINKKVPINKMDFSLAPKVMAYEELMQMFYLVRDTRFLYEKASPDFARRISWLYPDDGCFSRAAMTGIKLNNEHLLRPAKIFSFGDLMITTPYSSAGAVYWWYHVAGVVNYMGLIYVLDPALKSSGPLLVEDWYNKMGEAENLHGVVCNEYTYDPFDYCFKATHQSDARARKDQSEYLKREWIRVQSLGLEPKKILGDNPPWN